MARPLMVLTLIHVDWATYPDVGPVMGEDQRCEVQKAPSVARTMAVPLVPHPEPQVADDHLRVRDPELLESQYLVRLLTGKPQRSSAHPCIAFGHGRRPSAEIPVTRPARCRWTANSTARSTTL